MRRLVSLVLSAVAAAVLSSGAALSAEAVKIGVVLSLSGPAAVFGIPERDAIQVAIDQYAIFERIPEDPLPITCSTIRIAAANARGNGSLGTSFEAYFSRSQLNALT